MALCEEKHGDEISRGVMVTPLIEHYTKTQMDGEMKDSRSRKNVLLVFERYLPIVCRQCIAPGLKSAA